MKGAVDDFKVMLTRNEPLTGLARAVALLAIFALGVVAGLWAAAGARQPAYGSVVVPTSVVQLPSAAAAALPSLSFPPCPMQHPFPLRASSDSRALRVIVAPRDRPRRWTPHSSRRARRRGAR